MARTPTSTATSPVFIIFIIVIIVLIGDILTSGIEDSWLSRLLLVGIAFVLAWPLKNILEAREKRLEQDQRHDQSH